MADDAIDPVHVAALLQALTDDLLGDGAVPPDVCDALAADYLADPAGFGDALERRLGPYIRDDFADGEDS